MHVAYTSAIDNLLHINSQFYMEKHTKKRQINPHEFTKHSDRHELSRDKLKIQIKKILCIEFANFRIHMRFQMPPLQYLMDDNKQKKMDGENSINFNFDIFVDSENDFACPSPEEEGEEKS